MVPVWVTLAVLGTLAVMWTLWRSQPRRPKPTPTPSVELPDLRQTWIVSPLQAKRLIETGATWLDARQFPLPRYRRIRGAHPVRWQDFARDTDPYRGQLRPVEDLQASLQQLGIDGDRPVVVMGDPQGGWGEEGRIVWMLRSLGHEAAVFVDGGMRGLEQVGLPVSPQPATPGVRRGNFQPRPTDAYRMRLEQLQQRLGDRALTILDSREPREYQGATPYGESRGGCVPGAIALYYRQLLREDGFLKPEAEIRQILADKGVQGEEVVAYCTGGVRSAWLVAVLQSLDAPRFRGVYNYPGSMWEWSSRPASDCPLVIPRESG